MELEPGAPGDLAGDASEPGVGDVHGSRTAHAHEVVMMGRAAADVGVGAIGQVESLEQSKPLEELERAEDGRPPDGCQGPFSAGTIGDQIAGGERTLARGDELGHESTRLGQALSSRPEGGGKVDGLVHAWIILPRETQSQVATP